MVLLYAAMPEANQQQRRRQRRREAEVHRRRLRYASLLVLVVLAASAYTVMSLADRSSAQVPEEALLVSDQPGDSRPVNGSEGHPVFARVDDRNLVLPVAARDATIIAYHPLSDERAYSIQPIGRQLNGGVVSRGLERVFSEEDSVRYYLLKGKGRSAAPTAGVDIGAAAGVPITAPISGQVSGVKTYQLYGKYEDVQIDIRPDGLSGIEVSLLFVDQPVVTIGQTVVAGKTQLGKVRAVQGDLGARLAAYTHDSGSHVHLRVTRDPAP
jgi:murein DD-endopeptidase MepM/ murein hydrolase activator NlpD